MRVLKFQLAITDEQRVSMPYGAEILTLQAQDGIPCLWALCPDGVAKEERLIRIVGTGTPIPDEHGPYIGTVQIPPFVWHVFEVRA